jgi:hypothetical protein
MSDGDTIPGVGLEVDRVFPDAPTPKGLQILAHSPIATPECDQRAVTITNNVLLAFGTGPPGAIHPSVPKASSFGYTLTDPTDP